MREHRSSRSAAPARTEDRSARSKTESSTLSDPLADAMSATASVPRCSLRAVMTTRAPAPASAMAVALPMPELPPVTMTVLPSMEGTAGPRHSWGS